MQLISKSSAVEAVGWRTTSDRPAPVTGTDKQADRQTGAADEETRCR